jgi:alkanesulfonate monooxygenase SsuD/methylene tetrahydromethanopterin reductase-like flavin-dependent oxidoreductase (luciferase family)
MEGMWSPFEKATIEKQLRTTFVGSPRTVKDKLQTFLNETQADEIIINGQIYDHQARLRSFELLADVIKEN